MAVYYNEIDQYAADWLRNLMKAGAIAPGEVDTRSIVDVRPEDLKGFTQHHFFAGIGGWSLALRLAAWPDDRPVWTGSCPCQPFSSAGKRKGQSDDRHLWPEWLRLIREYRPAIIFGEQVAAATAHGWLDEVAYGLETENYALGAAILPACAADAFHRRDRLWFVANALDGQFSEARRGSQRGAGQRDDDKGSAMAHTEGDGAWRGERNLHSAHGRPDGELHQRIDGASPIIVEDAESIGWGEGRPESAREQGRPSVAGASSARPGSFMGDTKHDGSHDTSQPGSTGESEAGGRVQQPQGSDTPRDVAYPDSQGCEELAGQSGAAGEAGQRHDGHDGGGIIWLECPDGKARPVESGICLLVNGLSPDMGADRPGEDSPYRAIIDPETGKSIGQAPWRIGMIKGFGNSIDSRVAAQFIAGAWEALHA